MSLWCIMHFLDSTIELTFLVITSKRDHMSRTYPAGSRVDSSNAKPLVAWAMGCQLVALNFQTHDSAMVLNDGRFRQNGGCGYVLKPNCLLEDGCQSLGKEIMLNIRVLSGTCLPKPKAEKVGEVIDPYVAVRLYDVVDDEIDPIGGSLRKDFLDRAERVTNDVRDNGYCPQWNSEEFTFAVKAPDVAMLSFYVIDSDGGFLDDTTCKVSHISQCHAYRRSDSFKFSAITIFVIYPRLLYPWLV